MNNTFLEILIVLIFFALAYAFSLLMVRQARAREVDSVPFEYGQPFIIDLSVAGEARIHSAIVNRYGQITEITDPSSYPDYPHIGFNVDLGKDKDPKKKRKEVNLVRTRNSSFRDRILLKNGEFFLQSVMEQHQRIAGTPFSMI